MLCVRRWANIDLALSIDCLHACPPTSRGHTIAWRVRKLALAFVMSSLLGMVEEGMGYDIAKEDFVLRRVPFFSLL